MPKVRIYRPAKTAMQSGYGRTKDWVVEFVPEARQQVDRLMGWTGHGDTRQQLRLRFATQKEAIAYADKNGLDYVLSRQRERKLSHKSYADNFSSTRQGNWTH